MLGLRARKADVLPYDMFDLAKQAYDAKKADKLENIYHKGQERAWSGKEILPMLIEKHGAPDLPEEQKQALARIFAIILWGELAAWKISAQLAEGLEPLEARMAATSQAHDEARHFYTIYDYLNVLGFVPESIDRRSEKVLEYTLRARTLAHKVCGMQLMIETIALTIFHAVRRANIEPVLGELLRYFEVDEARHIGLGINYLPHMIQKMNKLELVEFMAFEARLLFWVTWSMKALEPDLRVLGMNPREQVELGKAKQWEVFREMWGQLGVDIDAKRPLLSRLFETSDEILFPYDPATPMRTRIRTAWKVLRESEAAVDRELAQEAEDLRHSDTVLEGMGAAGSKWWQSRKNRRDAAAA
jgi:hypothetical protein